MKILLENLIKYWKNEKPFYIPTPFEIIEITPLSTKHMYFEGYYKKRYDKRWEESSICTFENMNMSFDKAIVQHFKNFVFFDALSEFSQIIIESYPNFADRGMIFSTKKEAKEKMRELFVMYIEQRNLVDFKNNKIKILETKYSKILKEFEACPSTKDILKK